MWPRCMRKVNSPQNIMLGTGFTDHNFTFTLLIDITKSFGVEGFMLLLSSSCLYNNSIAVFSVLEYKYKS